MDFSAVQSVITLFQMICVIIVFAYLFTRSRYFTEVIEHTVRLKTLLILILVFGLLSVYGTISGFSLYGAMLNVRDLGPLIGGLTCGPYVGIGAGIIGGIYRFAQGGPYMYTGLFGAILAGLLGGIMYYANKREFVPTWVAIVFTACVESLVSSIALLVATPPSQFFTILIVVAIPMIVTNMAAVAIFSLIIHNLLTERRTKKEKEQLEREMARKDAELQIAAEIQRSFLPDTIPQIEGFDIAGTSIPAKEVGGDFFDVMPFEVIPFNKSRIGVMIADVSGKGVPAALFMALSRIVVRVSATWFKKTAEVISFANPIITRDSKTGMFVTLFYGVLDNETRKITYVNAGHNPPLVLRDGLGRTDELEATGIAIGAMEDAPYQQAEIILATGDILVLYTDGVTEAINERNEMFEIERLVTAVKETRTESAKQILDSVIRNVMEFSGNQPQYDDITLMIVKVL